MSKLKALVDKAGDLAFHGMMAFLGTTVGAALAALLLLIFHVLLILGVVLYGSQLVRWLLSIFR